MKYLCIIFAVSGLITGSIAAIYWYRSSGVNLFPDWGLPGTGKQIEPVEEEQRQIEINSALQNGLIDSGRFNKTAALWTGASTVLNCLSAVIGALN